MNAAGIAHLSLVGSQARGDAATASDVDLVALENRLSDSLSSPLDLAPARSLREGIRERVAEEAVFAF